MKNFEKNKSTSMKVPNICVCVGGGILNPHRLNFVYYLYVEAVYHCDNRISKTPVKISSYLVPDLLFV